MSKFLEAVYDLAQGSNGDPTVSAVTWQATEQLGQYLCINMDLFDAAMGAKLPRDTWKGYFRKAQFENITGESPYQKGIYWCLRNPLVNYTSSRIQFKFLYKQIENEKYKKPSRRNSTGMMHQTVKPEPMQEENMMFEMFNPDGVPDNYQWQHSQMLSSDNYAWFTEMNSVKPAFTMPEQQELHQQNEQESGMIKFEMEYNSRAESTGK